MKQKIVLFDIDYTLFDTDSFKKSKLQDYIKYDEVKDVLVQLGGVAELGIFSEGKEELQKNKLLKTGITDHFIKEHIHIVEKKDEVLHNLLKKYKDVQLYLIDDKLTNLYAAKKINPSIYTIWIKRGKYALKQQPIGGFTPDATFTTLHDIIRIIT